MKFHSLLELDVGFPPSLVPSHQNSFVTAVDFVLRHTAIDQIPTRRPGRMFPVRGFCTELGAEEEADAKPHFRQIPDVAEIQQPDDDVPGHPDHCHAVHVAVSLRIVGQKQPFGSVLHGALSRPLRRPLVLVDESHEEKSRE